ncbi:unnamed protein product [Rotaria sp. Silwood2]|nr:unnamed protein product [Rotaria sp. Silwood2]
MGVYLSDFYPRLKSELEKEKQCLELIKEIDRNLKDVDRPKMKRILERVDHKLPSTILTVNADYNCDQENEREIEEMEQAEVASVVGKTSAHEDTWTFDTVFEQNFREKCLREEKGYLKLKQLRKCFEFTDIKHLKNLKWHNKVLATENFITTIEDVDDKNKRNQTDYLKPVNMILIHRTGKEVYFIIVSTFEAQYLIKLFHEKQDPKVSIMHIDDVNGPTMVPTNAVMLTKEEINKVVAVIRLFNGDCHYNTEEINVIKKCVAIVESNAFHEKKTKSEEIHNELESRHYLTNSFITSKLATQLANENDRILLETEAELGIDLQHRLHSIINESISEDAEIVWRLPELIKQLIRIRGKSEQY